MISPTIISMIIFSHSQLCFLWIKKLSFNLKKKVFYAFLIETFCQSLKSVDVFRYSDIAYPWSTPSCSRLACPNLERLFLEPSHSCDRGIVCNQGSAIPSISLPCKVPVSRVLWLPSFSLFWFIHWLQWSTASKWLREGAGDVKFLIPWIFENVLVFPSRLIDRLAGYRHLCWEIFSFRIFYGIALILLVYCWKNVKLFRVSIFLSDHPPASSPSLPLSQCFKISWWCDFGVVYFQPLPGFSGFSFSLGT